VVQPSSSLWPDLGECYRHYLPRLFAYIYGRLRDTPTTEDLVSEVFRRVFAEARALPDEEVFETRLFTVARDLLISHRRGRSPLEGSPWDDLLQTPDLARILDQLRRLPLREQDVIALKFDAQLTNAQIAQVMQLPERKVRMILYRTLREVRKALEQTF
jgi:RNA polymerase sigma-70 factor (ECF subfamily)